MEEHLGRIETGCLADIIAIDLDQPHLFATGSVVNSLVESACGADVKHSVIHGKLVMKNRELLTIDEEKVLYDTEKIMGTHPYFTKPAGWCGDRA